MPAVREDLAGIFRLGIPSYLYIMQTNNHCPICKGTGKMKSSMTVYGSDKPPEEFEITCIHCKGIPMSEAEGKAYQKALDRENAKWCTCENVNPDDMEYVPDGQSKKCRKHHWIHTKCGKITQVG